MAKQSLGHMPYKLLALRYSMGLWAPGIFTAGVLIGGLVSSPSAGSIMSRVNVGVIALCLLAALIGISYQKAKTGVERDIQAQEDELLRYQTAETLARHGEVAAEFTAACDDFRAATHTTEK